MRNGNIAFSEMLSNVCKDKQRNDLLENLLDSLLKDKSNYILFLSDRKDQLNQLYDKFKNVSCIITSNNNQIDSIQGIRLIFGISSMVKEGFSYKNLNCLVFGSPKKDIKQIIGRIYRKTHTVQPKIYDVIDNNNIFKSMYKKRKEQYTRLINNVKYNYSDLKNNSGSSNIELITEELEKCVFD
jgi:hypothetical protein